MTKLNKRLAAIESCVGDEFDHIWDCCCDHGKLGKQLLRMSAGHIHFVDIVPSIIEPLTASLAAAPLPKNAKYSVYCQDVAKLPLDKFSTNDRHLIIIAGVGGELTLRFVEQLSQRYAHLPLQFLLCPLRHQFEMRKGLDRAGLRLLTEQLIEHDKRFYEILLVGNTDGEKIVDVGSQLWQQPTSMHIRYVTGILAHYQRMKKNPTANVDNNIARYQQLLSSLTLA